MSLRPQQGFSLTELLIALAISSVVVASMYGAFIQQQRVSTQQEQLTEARQNARLSMDAMTAEIRMAGFDPGGIARDSQGNSAGILGATGTTMRFTQDLNCNGTLARGGADTTNEDVAYIFDVPNQQIVRQGFTNGNPIGGAQPLASNIIRLDFCYFLAPPPPDPANPETCTLNPAPRLNDIRAVQITLTARATSPDARYTDPDRNNNPNFRNFHKATLISLVRLRNLGLDRGNGLDFNDPC